MSRTEERPVSAVIADIVCNVEEIVRSEVRLAKAQIKNEVADAATSATRLIYGGVLAATQPGFCFWLQFIFCHNSCRPGSRPWSSALSFRPSPHL